MSLVYWVVQSSFHVPKWFFLLTLKGIHLHIMKAISPALPSQRLLLVLKKVISKSGFSQTQLEATQEHLSS